MKKIHRPQRKLLILVLVLLFVAGSSIFWKTDRHPVTTFFDQSKFTNIPYQEAAVIMDPQSTSSQKGFIPWSASDTGTSTMNISLGKGLHVWNPMLGGVVWLNSKKVAKEQAAAFAAYQTPVLVDIKATSYGFGYRFDQDSFERSTIEAGWFKFDGTDAGEPTDLDDIFQIYGKSNVQFIINIPIPNSSLQLGVDRFAWQTPEFYGAQLQYLFGKADSSSVYSELPMKLDFSSQSDTFNWANLRAKRGRVEPYRAEAIILGEEPYHIEGWGQDGKGFGEAVEKYRVQLRKRGVTLPYGVHTSQLSPVDREWFNPMMDAISKTDLPKYIDLYHYYTLSTASADWLRSYPVAMSTEGFENYWKPQTSWASNYTRSLWLIEDTKNALKKRGLNPDDFKLGFSEHGMTISSQFKLNDMTGALHWALWLSETMRYNTQWDSMWTLVAEGFSTAQLQYYGGITPTPAFFAYEIAMQMRGLTYLETSSDITPYGTMTNPQGKAAIFPWVVVRGFEDKKTGNRELFVINQHPNKTVVLTGCNGCNLKYWIKMSGATYETGNPLGSRSPLQVKNVAVNTKNANQMIIEPLSIHRIILGR